MYKKGLLCMTIMLLVLIWLSANAEGTEHDSFYIYNPSFHGSLLYDREGGIIGILMNGAEITEDMIITEKPDASGRHCVKFPGRLAYAWIEESHLFKNKEEVLDSCLLTGICNRIMDSGLLYTSPASPYDLPSDVYLKDGERVTIAGRYGTYFYLPDNPPHWIHYTELPMRSNMASAKYRIYASNLLCYTNLWYDPIEPDGTEQFNQETALERARELTESIYGVSLDGINGSCRLNATHIYSSIGKTWRFHFGQVDDGLFYQGELIDRNGELYHLAQGEDEFNAAIYEGYPTNE